MLNSDDVKSDWTEHTSSAVQGENKALYVLLVCFKEKKKVLHFRDVDFYFLAKVGRANIITFSDCKLLLHLYIMNLTLSMCI